MELPGGFGGASGFETHDPFKKIACGHGLKKLHGGICFGMFSRAPLKYTITVDSYATLFENSLSGFGRAIAP